jgi:IPT/TIG domain
MSALRLRPTVRVPFISALVLLFTFGGLAGTADAASKAKKKKRSNLPTVTSVTPEKVSVGDTLIIKGKNFTAGTGKNTVLFRPSSGGKFVFAPTLTATSTRIVLKVPSRIADQFAIENGLQVATRFQLRVVSTRASTAFTPVGASPLILPQPGGSALGDCDKDGTSDAVDADDDNDGLSDAIEVQYKLEACNVDSDGDGVWDSFEFESALDLNGRAVPFPGKKPWPNPLDGSDVNADFDGDGLHLDQEHRLWQAAGRPFPLNYSDGTQYTGGPIAAPSPDVNSLDGDSILADNHYDPENDRGPSLRTGEGYLSDDEKDFDGDGLANNVEFNWLLTKAYWKAFNSDAGEGNYELRPFNDLDPTDPDSDGDGILDGADDQDSDGWSNVAEQYRHPTYATGFHGYMVNPFNPCLPDYHSPTCTRYLLIGGTIPSPFHLDSLPVAPIGWVFANPDIPGMVTGPIDSPDAGFVP